MPDGLEQTMIDLTAELSATVIAQRAYFSALKTVRIVNEKTQIRHVSKRKITSKRPLLHLQ